MDFVPEICIKSAFSPCGYCASSYKNESDLRTGIRALYAQPVSAVDQVSVCTKPDYSMRHKLSPKQKQSSLLNHSAQENGYGSQVFLERARGWRRQFGGGSRKPKGRYVECHRNLTDWIVLLMPLLNSSEVEIVGRTHRTKSC
jgi:hypothetical protein